MEVKKFKEGCQQDRGLGGPNAHLPHKYNKKKPQL